jgi:hypothetical protein
MSDPYRDLASHGAAAELTAIREGALELAIYLQRLAGALAGGRVGELAHELTDGASIAHERQLPLILTHIDAEIGRLRGLANRHSGRLLAALELRQAADVADRRRLAQRRSYGPLSEEGRVAIVVHDADSPAPS